MVKSKGRVNMAQIPPIVQLAIAFVVGFIAGWIVEWIIDVGYRQTRELKSELARRQPGSQPDLSHDSDVLAELIRGQEEETRELRAQIAEKEMAIDSLRDEFETYMQSHPDELTAIKGIGRIYQWKLRDAGINSYAHLAQATPERIREIIDAPAWRKVEPELWIAQARQLSERG
jgi:predicted flap endonuclease-1-like 5' DNA nuclease